MSRLFLSHLSLSHFRSHQHSVLTCDERPVALFGPNGAGKTNVLEAVSILSPGRGLRGASAQDMTRRPAALGWKITSLIHAGAYPQEVTLKSENGAARQLRLDDKATTQLALGEIARVLWLIPAMDRLWIEGAEGRRRFLDRMTLSFQPTHARHALTYEKAMRERNRLLKDQVQDPAWYSALEAQMAEAGTALHAGRLATLEAIAAAQKNAQTAFPAARLTLDADVPAEAEDLRHAFADNRRQDLIAGRTLIGPHRSDLAAVYQEKDLPARDCSTGEQKALLVSLILSNARALAARETPALLLLDEVAAHLDAGRQAALYDEICALGAQAWMTGTGPDMFAAFGPRAQRFEVTEEGGASQVKRLADTSPP
ncbi:MAG: DNA replication/repair protein RecF [Pseudomonadota bacterium]